MNNNDSTGHGIDGTPTVPQYGEPPAPAPIQSCPYNPGFRTNGAYFTGPASSSYADRANEGYTGFTGSGHSDTFESPAQTMENGFGLLDAVNSTLSDNQAAIQSAAPSLFPNQVSGEIFYTETGKLTTCITGVAIDNNTALPAAISSAGINTSDASTNLYPNELSIGTASAQPFSNSAIVKIPPFCFNPYQEHNTWITAENSAGQYATVNSNGPNENP